MIALNGDLALRLIELQLQLEREKQHAVSPEEALEESLRFNCGV
jgi:hypothetical protein